MDKMLAEGIINTFEKYFRKVVESFDYLDKNIDIGDVKTIDDLLDKICDYEETYKAFIDALHIINIIAGAFADASFDIYSIIYDHLSLMASQTDDEAKRDKAHCMLDLVDIASEMQSALALLES